MQLSDKQFFITAGIAVVVGVVLYNKATSAVETIFTTVNPLDDNFFLYQGVDKVGEIVTGDKNYDFSFSQWLHDITNTAADYFK